MYTAEKVGGYLYTLLNRWFFKKNENFWKTLFFIPNLWTNFYIFKESPLGHGESSAHRTWDYYCKTCFRRNTFQVLKMFL